MSEQNEAAPNTKNDNVAHALEFLRKLRGEGAVHLTAIIPDGAVVSKTFHADQQAEIAAFIQENNGKKNIYVHVNPLKAGLVNVKATKAMIAAAEFAHVDIDDEGALDRLKAFHLQATAIVSSGGGGANAYFKFQHVEHDLEAVERVNKWLVQELGGDKAATDVSRILRVPGTKNLPTKKKIEKGRKIAWARFLADGSDWTRTYELSEFGQVAESNQTKGTKPTRLKEVESGDPITLQDLPKGLSERMLRVAQLGDDPERPRGKENPRYPSRSEGVFAVSCDLAREGFDENQIAGVLLNPALGISASILEKKNPKAEAVRQAKKAILTVGNDWPDGMQPKTNLPNRGLQNTQLAIFKLGITCRFDVFRNRMTVSGQVLQTHFGDLSDRICLFVRDQIGKVFQFDPGNEMTRDAIVHLCSLNTFDPIRDYLDGLKWDGIPRIDEFLIKFLSAEDTPYVRAVSSITLIAAVRRVRQPGCKFDTIMVWESDQGAGKSTVLKILASPEFFSDQDILALDQKAQMEVMEGVWIFEICELEGMRHTDVNKIKAFASRAVDKARPAYGRVTEQRPRRGILVGTTNDDQYLKDETGNRRFWPVVTGEIDLQGIEIARDQLWAEAAVREAQGESIVLPKELWAAAAVEQAQRVAPDPWRDTLENVKGWAFNGRELIASQYLMSDELRVSNIQNTNYVAKRLAKVMRGLGWNGPETLTFQNGHKAKGYWRATQKEDEPHEGGI